MAPCLLGYFDVAAMLVKDERTVREGNTYWPWIENYVAEDYKEAVRLGSGNFLCSGEVNLADWFRIIGEVRGEAKPIKNRGTGQNLHTCRKGKPLHFFTQDPELILNRWRLDSGKCSHLNKH